MVRWCMLIALAGCASEIAARNPQSDPTNAQAEEAPVRAAPELPQNDPTLAVSEPPQVTPTPEPPAEHHRHEASPPSKPKPRSAPKTIYTCPMHPEVRSDKPGTCPKCGMTLQKVSP